ncbi:ATP-binding cassette domain-containing protein [Sandarakinorhabdus limnophila]|uniref:ATP-binding cassette domain-containing protein n=1 Tax=Sandarakinorhabdus limnophila TaxID=210512 RepID=UPI0026F12C05|nr:ATP-binding cassette domain-containing protein [Sandarakinorhabdus limnophila]MCM0033445.1 ATP-binding cassette domain-containing protein [Sandarakinorhabdus limnophila]
MAEGLSVSITRAGPLLVDAAFHVPPGQTMALVGPSGAGKSTILKAIAGLLPTTGTVRVDGQDWQTGPHGLPAWQRRVGLVLQGGGLFPHLDALGNVMIAQATPDRDAALALLAAMQMGGAVIGRRPAQLSGGEQMRVALARALARDPAVLLLDEPFAAVDPPVRRALIALVAGVRQQSAAPMIIVTHDLAEAAGSADTCAFIDQGRIIEQGPAAAVHADPASRLNQWLTGPIGL